MGKNPILQIIYIYLLCPFFFACMRPLFPPKPSILLLTAKLPEAENIIRSSSKALANGVFLKYDTLEGARVALRGASVDLLFTDVFLGEEDVLDFLSHHLSAVRGGSARVVVHMNRCSARLLSGLYDLSIAGVVLSGAGTTDLASTFAAVAQGRSHWPDGLVAQLQRDVWAKDSAFAVLTPTEKLILALAGDGSYDDSIADYLSLRPGTVAAIRWSIYRKLRLHDRAGLMRKALELGFIHMEGTRLSRPGIALLSAARTVRPAQRMARSLSPVCN